MSEAGLPRPSTVESLLGGVEDIDKASYIILHCLWCDQGMAHLLEVYEEGGSQDIPAALVLIDFGAEQMFKSRVLKANQAAPAVGFIVEKLLQLVEAGKEARIERVVISHQDTDHWSLINYLLDAVEAKEIDLKIGKVAYGGSDWAAGAKAAVARLGEYTADAKKDLVPWTGFYTDYNGDKGTKTELFHVGDVYLRTLVVNAPVTSKSPSLKKNGTSAMMVIEFKGTTYILPGDATWETLKSANGVIDNWVKKQKANPVIPCFVASAPHHGSLETIVPKSKAADIDFTLASKFTDLTRPNSVIASAGSKNSFKHPYLSVLGVLASHIGQNGFGSHPIVVYIQEESDWQVLELIGNLYTTVLSTALPVKVANWSFALDSDGEKMTVAGTFEQPTKESVMPGTEDDEMKEDEPTGLFAVRSPLVRASALPIPFRRVQAPLPRAAARPVSAVAG